MGPDGIHPRVLKELANVTMGHLSLIYQRSGDSGEVIADCKLANLIPLYHKGMREDPASDRLLLVSPQLLEKLRRSSSGLLLAGISRTTQSSSTVNNGSERENSAELI